MTFDEYQKSVSTQIANMNTIINNLGELVNQITTQQPPQNPTQQPPQNPTQQPPQNPTQQPTQNPTQLSNDEAFAKWLNGEE